VASTSQKTLIRPYYKTTWLVLYREITAAGCWKSSELSVRGGSFFMLRRVMHIVNYTTLNGKREYVSRTSGFTVLGKDYRTRIAFAGIKWIVRRLLILFWHRLAVTT